MTEIKAIPTIYNGIQFRSRLEARWAVFFDACGVEWEYEPEGFELEDGTMYLPDFKLHNVVIECNTDNIRFDYAKHRYEYQIKERDLWVEVKGQMSETDANKVRKFAGDFVEKDNDDWYVDIRLRERPITIVSNIPRGDTWDDMMCDSNSKLGLYKLGLLTTDTEWEISKHFCIDFDGRLRLTHGGARMEDGVDEELTMFAYRIAYNAKFDHGLTPKMMNVRDALRREEYKRYI